MKGEIDMPVITFIGGIIDGEIREVAELSPRLCVPYLPPFKALANDRPFNPAEIVSPHVTEYVLVTRNTDGAKFYVERELYALAKRAGINPLPA